jgi:AraC family transcriptional regulator of arabinose operon
MRHGSELREAHVLKVLKLIESDLAGDLTVARLAQTVGLSPSRLSHLFQESQQMSLKQYVRNQRVSRAFDLLMTTRKSVKEVAAEVGFYDTAHFSRVFKKAVGRPPSQSRQSSRNVQ